MRRTLLLSSAIMTAIVVPAVALAGFDGPEPVTVRLADAHVGDVYRYRHLETSDSASTEAEAEATTSTRSSFASPGEPDSTTTVNATSRTESETVKLVAFEGEEDILDRYGRPVRADAHRVEDYQGDELLLAYRCLTLRGSEAGLRADELVAGTATGASAEVQTSIGLLGSGGDRFRQTNYTTSFVSEGSCLEFGMRVAVPLVEGETYSIAELFLQPVDDPAAQVRSTPAEATTFHGRPALRLLFDIDAAEVEDEFFDIDFQAHIELVYADGLPVLAQSVVELSATFGQESFQSTSRLELEGLTQGSGAVRAPLTEEPLAAPPVEMAPFDPLALDDVAFALPYPYAEAFAAVKSDPRLGLGEWLRAHPDAYLFQAWYDREREPTAGRGREILTTDGAWMLAFRDGGSVYYVDTVRGRAPGPLGSVPVTENSDMGEPWIGPIFGAVRELPREYATSDELATRASAFDIDVVAGLTYQLDGSFFGGAPQPTLELTAVAPSAKGSTEGPSIGLDLLDSGAVHLGTTVQRSSGGGPLGPLAGQGSVDDGRDDRFAALALLAGPVPGAGLAGGAAAATGLALLMVALKFGLVPFFTRLVRDRLLDNPVRGRLFERVRAEPGIRQGELVDFAGVGEGATRRHLDQLVKHRFLVRIETGAFVSYYAAGEVPPALARRAALLRGESPRRVYELYAREPALSLREAGARLDMSAPNVHRVKKKLEDAGLLPAAPDAGALVAEA